MRLRNVLVISLATLLFVLPACSGPAEIPDAGEGPTDGSVDARMPLDTGVVDATVEMDGGEPDADVDGGEPDADLDGGEPDGGEPDGGEPDGGTPPECTIDGDCDDGDACTVDTCDVDTCSSTAIDPNDDDVCTIDSCDPATGVAHDPIDVDDGDVCTTDACDSTTGESHAPVADCCETTADCASGVCASNVCQPASCADGVQNDEETAIDCGGTVCLACPLAAACLVDGDCLSGACVGDVCVECASASTCPGTDTECRMRTCISNECGLSFVAAATVTTAQTPNDCQQNECDGSGGIVGVPASGDVPLDDGNVCTDEACASGAPTHPPVTVPTMCDEGGGTVCSAGSCVACVAASDCPATGNECTVRTCIANVCGTAPVAAGTVTTAQTPGDCRQNECDGAGAIASNALDTDLPVDGNPCTNDVCTAGVPSHPSAPSGTSCGTGSMLCDGAGACVGCVTASTCPGTDTECRTRTCVAGTCGFSFTAAGTPTSSQTAGDCQRNECDGAGAIESNALDTDLPVDTNQCTDDVCTAGVPSHPSTAAGATCSQSGGSLCSGTGTCVECLVAATCPGTDTECRMRTCTAGSCGFAFTAAGTPTSSQTAGDCQQNQCDGSGAIVSAASNADVPADDGNQCTGEVCTAGVPSHPARPVDTACNQGGGSFCSATATCVACNAASQCPGSDTECQARTCSANTCGFSFVAAGTPTASQTAGDCQRNQCNGAGAIVSAAFDSDLPASDGNECTSEVCTAGVASHPPVAAGTPTSGQTAGDCQQVQCNGAGGTTSVAQNTDLPADDGFQCTDDVCTGGAPAHPPRAGGAACSENGGVQCDGVGSCVQCIAASECPVSTNECEVRACISGACGTTPVPGGTPTPTQSSDDCETTQCNGSGGTIGVPNDTETPPDDGNQCTTNVCAGGAPAYPAAGVGSPCSQSGGTVCDGAGSCVSPPAVASTTPADGTSVLATTSIAVTFTQAMNPGTLTGQTTAGACTGSIQVSLDNFASCVAFSSVLPTMSAGNTTATLTAVPGLLVNRDYDIRVTTAATSAIGIALASQYTSATGFTTGSPSLCESSVVIAQVFGGGGTNATVPNADYVVLHNRGATPVTMANWSLQYASSGGSSWGLALTPVSGTIAPGAYFLVRIQAPQATGTSLPTPDASGTNFNLSGSAGKIALVSNTTALTGTCPTSASIVDFVGYGAMVAATGCWEGAASTPAPSGTTAVFRVQSACGDVNNNAADFTTGAPAPLNSASPVAACSCVAQNESGAALEADYCNTQFPASISGAPSTTSTVYGRLYEMGATDSSGTAVATVRAQVGYGPATANPEYEAGWTWTNATYNAGFVDASNDEYQATITLPAAGSYRYVYRFSLDNGVSWTTCDQNAGDTGAGSNTGLTFELQSMSVMTSM